MLCVACSRSCSALLICAAPIGSTRVQIAASEAELRSVSAKVLEQRGVALTRLSVASRRTGLYGRLVRNLNE